MDSLLPGVYKANSTNPEERTVRVPDDSRKAQGYQLLY